MIIDIYLISSALAPLLAASYDTATIISSGVSESAKDIPFCFRWMHKGTGNHRKPEFQRNSAEFHISVPFPVAGEDLRKTELPAKVPGTVPGRWPTMVTSNCMENGDNR